MAQTAYILIFLSGCLNLASGTWLAFFDSDPYLYTFEKVPQDCQEVFEQGDTESGIYMISPDGFTKMEVYCEQEVDGGGWTVFQRRINGRIDFFQDWAAYKLGFGDLTGEFWLGNDKLHLLTKRDDQKLKIELKNFRETVYADYLMFKIENEKYKYRLTVSGFSGAMPPGDSLTMHSQANFSTKDQDNENAVRHCAANYTGAWWYTDCHMSNLNGLYGSTTYGKGVNWQKWKGHFTSLNGTMMMIKRRP